MQKKINVESAPKYQICNINTHDPIFLLQTTFSSANWAEATSWNLSKRRNAINADATRAMFDVYEWQKNTDSLPFDIIQDRHVVLCHS